MLSTTDWGPVISILFCSSFALLEKGNKFYEVLEGSDRIRVTVEAPRNVIQELSASDIVAEFSIQIHNLPHSLTQLLRAQVPPQLALIGHADAFATCYLPLSDNLDLSKELGTRHRAGVGVAAWPR